MKKILLYAGMATMIAAFRPAAAQTAATLAESPLPAAAGFVLRPQNAGSSTLQNVNFMGAVNHLYVHSWDVFSMATNNGIAWRRLNAGGGLLNQGQLNIAYANDIDVALFANAGNYYVLAAFYFDDGSINMGHYYNIYQFVAGGLVPVSTMNLLALSATFGRINVDANTPYGVAITWCTPGTGIYVKAATLPGLAFGGNVLLPGTAAYKDPDVCILRYSGGSGLSLQIAELANSNTQVREQFLDFFTAAAGGAAGLTTEYIYNSAVTLGTPRIDCPDQSGAQRWAMVFSEYNFSGGITTETIRAGVKNGTWSAVPVNVVVHNTSFAAVNQLNNPVVAYNDASNRIQVGWMTRDNTVVIPGLTKVKYVAQQMADLGTSAPASIPGSYMMISNTDGGPSPVLAFSGQNGMSAFNGLHTAYSQYNTFFPSNYCMVYKDKPWSAATFKMSDEHAAATITPSVFPNPFVNTLSLVLPLKGHYEISITGIDGKRVYEQSSDFEAMQQAAIHTADFGPGIYILKISSVENQLDYTTQLLK